ncbi:MAG: MipA/OmpV family protein [Bdellovibrionota bacterium]|nr:MipA/OmpV family protein [Bdellovibrionota bacterium]
MKYLFLIFIVVGNLQAKEQWGIAVGGVSVPHYMGSAEHYQATVPFPFLLENDKIFFEDEGLYSNWTSELNLPISGDDVNATKPTGFDDENEYPVNSKDYARRGMGYLPPALYLGLNLGYKLGPVTLEFSSKPGVQIGGNWGNAGVINKASLMLYAFAVNKADSARCLCFRYDKIYTNDTYNKLYYGVEPQHAITDRPYYDARTTGLLGDQISVTYMQRFSSISIMAYGNLQMMDKSVVKDSPLVERTENMTIALALAYMF